MSDSQNPRGSGQGAVNEVKPVAWVQRKAEIDCLSAPLAQANRSGRYTEPLYDQQAIDALRSEVEGLRGDAERYRFIRGIGGCPFAETDSAWLSPTSLDAEIDIWMRIKADARAKEAQYA